MGKHGNDIEREEGRKKKGKIKCTYWLQIHINFRVILTWRKRLSRREEICQPRHKCYNKMYNPHNALCFHKMRGWFIPQRGSGDDVIEEVTYDIWVLKKWVGDFQIEENPRRRNNAIRHGGRKQHWIINSLWLKDRIFLMSNREKHNKRERKGCSERERGGEIEWDLGKHTMQSRMKYSASELFIGLLEPNSSGCESLSHHCLA